MHEYLRHGTPVPTEQLDNLKILISLLESTSDSAHFISNLLQMPANQPEHSFFDDPKSRNGLESLAITLEDELGHAADRLDDLEADGLEKGDKVYQLHLAYKQVGLLNLLLRRLRRYKSTDFGIADLRRYVVIFQEIEARMSALHRYFKTYHQRCIHAVSEGDMEKINKAALGRLEQFTDHHGLDAQMAGNCLVAYNPKQTKSRGLSLSINPETGAWSDFSVDDKGENLISLAAYLMEISEHDAARYLTDLLSLPMNGKELAV